MLGRPAIWAPVWKKVTAGSWLMASVFIDLMKHRSSTTLAVEGINSLTQAPDPPYWPNLKTDGATGRLSCVAVIPVRRCPMRTEPGSSWPRRSLRAGL